jgi:Na+/proline symporter
VTGWRRLAFALVLVVMLLWTLVTAFLLALLKIAACGGEACEQAAANRAFPRRIADCLGLGIGGRLVAAVRLAALRTAPIEL